MPQHNTGCPNNSYMFEETRINHIRQTSQSKKMHATWSKLNSDFWVERFLNMKPYQLNKENESKDK